MESKKRRLSCVLHGKEKLESVALRREKLHLFNKKGILRPLSSGSACDGYAIRPFVYFVDGVTINQDLCIRCCEILVQAAF